MKVAFPYMGCVTGFRKLMEGLGHEVVMPSKPTRGTMDLGVKHSPEFICFPFKVMLGTYIECAEAGARVIITSGGDGPCRAGLYATVHERILRNLGFDVEFIVFDSLFRDPKAFLRKLLRVKGQTGILRLLHTLVLTYLAISVMDGLEKRIKRLRAYERNRGEFNRVWRETEASFAGCRGIREVLRTARAGRARVDAVETTTVREQDRIRVGIVGEIYVVMESSTNMDLEENLNRLGVEVESVQYISDWVNHNLQPAFLGASRSHQVIEKARRFVRMNLGGHDMENIGWMVDFQERGFDGVVHLMPFGCLPELVTQSAIPSISRTLGLPILSLSLDEQMGTVNTQTRLEAFVDLLRNRRRQERPRPVCQPPAPFTTVGHIGFQNRWRFGVSGLRTQRQYT